MKVTGIELLQKIANEEIKENSEFKIKISEKTTWGEKIRYEENDLVFRENIKTNEEGSMYGRTIFNLWNLKSILDMKFESIEGNKEIEELAFFDDINNYDNHDIETNREKINELVRAVNKLIKESEEK